MGRFLLPLLSVRVTCSRLPLIVFTRIRKAGRDGITLRGIRHLFVNPWLRFHPDFTRVVILVQKTLLCPAIEEVSRVLVVQGLLLGLLEPSGQLLDLLVQPLLVLVPNPLFLSELVQLHLGSSALRTRLEEIGTRSFDLYTKQGFKIKARSGKTYN